MNLASLFDPQSAAIVIGGTLFATLMRSGRAEIISAGRHIALCFSPAFDYGKARAEIARQVEAIRSDGIFRADEMESSDQSLADATNALIHKRSVTALIAAHLSQSKERQLKSNMALNVLKAGTELAPVFGLAGTLFALSQIAPSGLQVEGLMGAVSMAVMSTLYGVMLAHMVFSPIAQMIERRYVREEFLRQKIVDWLTEQLADRCPEKGEIMGRRHADKVKEGAAQSNAAALQKSTPSSTRPATSHSASSTPPPTRAATSSRITHPSTTSRAAAMRSAAAKHRPSPSSSYRAPAR